MKRLTILLFVSLRISIFAQQHNNDTIYTHTSAIVSIIIKDSIPLGVFESVDKYKSYSIYKINVDSVYFIEVDEEFSLVFNEEYLLSCIYLVVPLEKYNGYKPKDDWNTQEKYRMEVDVGRGKKDLTFDNIVSKGVYVSKSNLIMSSFSLGCYENNEECKKAMAFFNEVIKEHK